MQQSYENIQDEFDNAYCASYLPEYSGTQWYKLGRCSMDVQHVPLNKIM